MSIKKQYPKSGSLCKVTFRLRREAARSAKAVHIVGEFNNWDASATPMRRLKNGGFTATILLEQGREYQFRYLFDESNWENDWEADRYASTPYGDAENSVVTL